MKSLLTVTLLSTIGFALFLSGCGPTNQDGGAPPAANGDHDHDHGDHDHGDHDHGDHDHGDHDHGDHDHDHGDHDHGQAGSEEVSESEGETVDAALAKLSPEDATAARQQKVCVVSGEMLGTMGAPKKIDVEGQAVWICCDGCREKLLASPGEFLAKLKNE